MSAFLSNKVLYWVSAVARASRAADKAALADSRFPGSTAIDTNEARERFDSGVPVIDVRGLRLYNKRHIPGAYHLELKNDFTPKNLASIIRKDEPAVIYCNGTHCSLSYKAVTKAVQWGFTNILYYREGMKAWRRSNNPVESVTE